MEWEYKKNRLFSVLFTLFNTDLWLLLYTYDYLFLSQKYDKFQMIMASGRDGTGASQDYVLLLYEVFDLDDNERPFVSWKYRKLGNILGIEGKSILFIFFHYENLPMQYTEIYFFSRRKN